MKVGVVRETAPGERRVALVPETAGKLVAAGFEVVVEQGAGAAASFPDDAYREAGATLASPWDADVVVKVRKPDESEIAQLHDGQLLIAFLDPLADRDGIARLDARGVVAFAMESIPRITRAQPMDALSSQATVGGYKAALLGRRAPPPLLPDADDRRGHRAAGEGARDRRRRRRPAGDRDRAPPRRRRHRLRRAPRREGADREPRRELARPRRHRRGGRGRLRARADARGDAGTAAGARGADLRVRRRDHDGRGSRPRGSEDHSRVCREGDAARLGDRRPRRRDRRQLRADRARRESSSARA